MPYEKGGRADKNGNRFEIRWVVYQLLQVLEEKIDYIILEALGQDEKGIDVWIGHKNGTKEGQQCKGRNGSKEYWDYGSVNAKGIFATWKFQLDRDKSNTVSLVSPLAFTFLEDLIERGKSSGGDTHNFYSGQILNSSKEFITFFENFCTAMSINKNEESELTKCISYLNRIIYRQTPDNSLKDTILDKIRYLLIGNEEDIYDLFTSWVIEGEILGKEISCSSIYVFLESKEIKLRNLTSDKRILPRINELNMEYEKSFSEIDDNLIFRNEFLKIREVIDIGESVILYGKAGRGKSGCTVDILNYCNENQIPHLAIKLDKRIPKGTAEIWGQEIGLPASIAHCIHSISKNTHAVIILDQLDALRWTQTHSREALLVCEQLIGEVTKLNLERNYNISVVFVCRSYDLENDNNISSLFKKSDTVINSVKWNKIQVNELSDNIIRPIIGTRYNQLTNKLKEILKIPSNLYIWKQLDPKRNYAECYSTSHLVSEWWNQLSEKCSMSGLDEIELNKIKSNIVNWLEKKGRIFFPLNILNISKSYVDFLSSNSFLVIHENKASFAHQSILDCFLADELFRKFYDEEKIINIIGTKDKQTPGKRYQVQMFLERLLEYDSSDFLNAGQEIFESDEIRYFIKFVFLEVLNQVEILDENIKGFILDKCEDETYEKHLINSVLMDRPQYVSLLREKGFLDKWFKDSKKKEIVFNLLGSICPNYTSEDILFVQKNIFNSEKDDNQFARCFPYDLNEGTDELFDLRMLFYEKYPEKADGYINFKSMMKNTEMRTIRFLEFLLKNKLKKHERNIYRFEEEFVDSDSEIFINKGKEVIKLLVPHIPASKDGILAYNEWSGRNNGNNGLERVCIQIVKKANANIISSEPEKFWKYYQKYMGKGFYLFNEILLDGFTHLPESYSDLVIEYLIQDFDNNIFVRTDGSGNELSLAKKVLIKHTERCSQDVFKKLENKILGYFPLDAKERYQKRIEYNKEKNGVKVYWSFCGDLQKELLEILAFDRISFETIEMIKVLNRKFPNGTRYLARDGIQSGIVSSPISGKKISDRQWVNILTNKKIKNRDYLSWQGNFVDNSIRGFSDSFRSAASESPKRMIELVIEHKESIFDDYIDSLFSGVAYSEQIRDIPIDLIESMISTFGHNHTSYRADYICSIIRNKSNVSWSSSIIEIVKDIAINHKNPEIGQVNVSNYEDKEMKTFEMLQSNALNCVRGSAARTIGELLWNDKSLFESFKATFERLASDENPAVKLATLFALLPSYNINQEWAEEQILTLYEQDYRFAGFPGTKDMLFLLYPKYREQVISVIMNCYQAEDKDLISMGAHCLIEMYILNTEFQDVLNNVDIMSKEQAKEILYMVNLYFNKDDFNEMSKEIILKCKNSTLDLEVPISTLFYNNLIDLDRDKDFLIEIMDSNMSRRTVYGFVHYLEQESKSIIDYKDIVISMSHQIITNRNVDTTAWGIDDEVSKLIIGLYDETSESSLKEMKIIAEECLTLWDLMFENQIGSIRSLSKKIMER